MKLLIIGGVAGGASAAARARRLSEDAEIVVLEKGHHPSFANCGLPYYVGGEIQSRDQLLVAPLKMLRERHRLDVRIRSEAIRIDTDQHDVEVRDLDSGSTYTESYDKLILATGASPMRPPIEGIHAARVLELRDLNDADIMHRFATSGAKRAVVVGAGFIGIEVAENLVRRGIRTTVVERGDQILPPWDRELVVPLEEQLRRSGVDLKLGVTAERFEETENGLSIDLSSGEVLKANFAVVSIGVRPESQLASEAGIATGSRGGIVVDQHMRTSDPDVYAVGDVAEVVDYVTKAKVQIPLAGPANRQGRIAVDHLFGRDSRFRGTQGTAIVGVFGMTAAMTGQSEKSLQRAGIAYQKIYIHPSDHAGYYPGAEMMTFKLVFDPNDGSVLGAQCVGGNGVDKRIDVVAMAIQAGMTVYDLEEAELCYAPQYGHAKDPINMAGFVAAGVLRGDQPVVHAEQLDDPESDSWFVLDARTRGEFDSGQIPGAVNVPVEELRQRLDEIPADRRVVCYCKVGQRGYLATRILLQHGFDAANLSGGYALWERHQNKQPDEVIPST